MAHPSPELRRSLDAWTAPGFGPRYITNFPVVVRNSKPRFSPPLPKSLLRLRTTSESWGCSIFSSACSFSSTVGTLLAPCIFTFFVLSLSFSGPFISAENLTRLTGKFTGRRLWRGCLRLLCFCTLRWCFQDDRIPPFARLQNCWRSTFSLSLCF